VSCCFDALQELSGVYHCLDEAKQQVAGLQDEQAQLFAKCEAETQSAAMSTAEVVTLKQELAESCEHGQAMTAHLASIQEVTWPHTFPVLCSDYGITLSSQLLQVEHPENRPQLSLSCTLSLFKRFTDMCSIFYHVSVSLQHRLSRAADAAFC
jgi:hypothetical protein